jgi:hypothetical protein
MSGVGEELNVLCDIAGRGSQAAARSERRGYDKRVDVLNNTSSSWGNFAKGMNVGHNIMAPLLLLNSCNFKLLRRQVLTSPERVGFTSALVGMRSTTHKVTLHLLDSIVGNR